MYVCMYVCMYVFIYLFIYVYLVLMVGKASPDLDSWDHSLPELVFRVHDPASGVSQASVKSYTFVGLCCDGIAEKSLSFIYIFRTCEKTEEQAGKKNLFKHDETAHEKKNKNMYMSQQAAQAYGRIARIIHLRLCMEIHSISQKYMILL